MQVPRPTSPAADRVIADLEHCGYHPFRSMVRALRENGRSRSPDGLRWGDPVMEAAEHIAAALVALRRAEAAEIAGVRVLYEALLMVAGGLARRYPKSLFLDIPAPRRASI